MNINEFNELIKEGIVAVDFYSKTCGPCKLLEPILQEVEKELTNIKFIRIEAYENLEISNKNNLVSLPTVIVFKDGKEIDRGAFFIISKERLIEWLNNAITKKDDKPKEMNKSLL